MFLGENPRFLSFKKNENPQSIYRTAIYTEKSKILEKTLPAAPDVLF